ncbi:GDNF-inducible zinc finger protein 1 [Eurytemora carolleeae]|uniref:GDNF-inducible zinc finger protein 1 n=1 Tax=Eurytemora carolleeae TaxID=1294199 RepID=UPI000C76D29C|nr:GDNF-inducible zinc finger protein 1 [Eurytemora carolleeae]|eukprot:XP_023341823.1 GDNF-inducible zinc finger protein 1-like [Eurytemora affinis]
MKGRVKLAFKKNGKKEKKNSEKQADTDSDIELLTGDEREGDGEDTSMTEDWAKFHQQEMEKNPGEGHTDKMESLVTPKDEKKHKKPKPVSESTKSEEKPNLEPEPTKPETVTELKTPKGTKSSNNGAKTPKSDSKTAPKANPLAKFLVKMKPGTIPPKTSAFAAPITYRKAPKPKAGARPVTTVAGAVSQLKTLQDGGGSESEDEVEGEEIALDDVAASSSEVKKPFHYSDKLSFKNKKLTPRFMKSEEEEEEEEEDDNLVDIEKKFSEINGWLENKTEQGCIRSTEGDRKKTFKCCVCSGEKIFPFRSDLKKHLVHCHLMSKKRESINKKYQCPDCFQLYSTWGNMNAHYREKHTPGRCQHSCNFCDKRFNRQDHFQLHVQSHTKDKSCQCSTCGLKISRPSGLSRHYSNKHPSPLSDECNGRSKQICRFCQEKFKTIALREDHIINYHGAQLDWLKEEKSRKQRDVQAILSLETSEEIEAYPLKKVLKELKKYTCAECGVQYAFPENLQKHARTLHQMMGKGQYTCNYCDEIFGFIYVKQVNSLKL